MIIQGLTRTGVFLAIGTLITGMLGFYFLAFPLVWTRRIMIIRAHQKVFGGSSG